MIRKVSDIIIIAALTIFYLVSSIVLFIYIGIKNLFSNGKKNDGCTSLTNKNYTKDIIPEYNKLLAFKRDDLAVHFVKKNKIEREIMLINFNKKINEKKS